MRLDTPDRLARAMAVAAIVGMAGPRPAWSAVTQSAGQLGDTVAVFDMTFYGRGANSLEPGDPPLAGEAGGILRRELERYPGWVVVDSARLAAQIGRAESGGVPCSTIACARDVGRALGARWVVTSKLSKTSNLIWYMFGQLIDVASGRLVTDQELELKGVASEIVPLGAQSLSRRIAKAAGVGNGLGPVSADTPPPASDRAAAFKARLAAAADTAPNLSGMDLSDLDLRGVDFRRANLTKAKLSGANLSGANLFTCDLTDAVLRDADLSGANLDGTILRRADFQKANLRKASLFATIIEAADLSGADLSNTRIIGYLKNAKLVGAILRSANIGADPGNQSMGVMNSKFVGADLSGADLSGANLYKADFSFAKLVKARLNNADLSNADLVQADFTGADVTGMQVAKANLTGAVFTGALGIRQLRGLEQARNRDKAVFDEHME